MIKRIQISTSTVVVVVLAIVINSTFAMSYISRTATTKSSAAASSSNPSATTVSLLTWNVNGLDPHLLHARAKVASNEILRLAPDVVFLQEVVQSTENIFGSSLEPLYKCCSIHDDIRMNGYYTMLFVRKAGGHTVVQDERITFDAGSAAQSFMGRDLHKIVVKLASQHEIVFFNTHLESLKESAPIRTAQLTYIFEQMMNLDLPACLAGDLNMRNVEQTQALKATNTKDSIIDVYEYFGRPRYASGTWLPPDYDDPTKKSFKCRFDRVYHNSYDEIEFISAARSGSRSKPITLVGDEKLCKSVKTGKMERPSDHLGMFIRLKLREKRSDGARTSKASNNKCSSSAPESAVPCKLASQPKNSGKKRAVKRVARDNNDEPMNIYQCDKAVTTTCKKSANKQSMNERRKIMAAAAERRMDSARYGSTAIATEEIAPESKKECSSSEVIDLT